jgi:hypothetical protein
LYHDILLKEVVNTIDDDLDAGVIINMYDNNNSEENMSSNSKINKNDSSNNSSVLYHDILLEEVVNTIDIDLDASVIINIY